MQALITYLTNLFSFDGEQPLLFTQFHFWVFFFIVFALFCGLMGVGRYGAGKPGSVVRGADGTPRLRKGRRLVRNGYLTLVSLLFYFKTSGSFVVLLMLSTLVGYVVGVRMDKLAEKAGSEEAAFSGGIGRRRKLWMVGAVAVNLFILFYFKYAYFFTDALNTMLGTHFEVVNYFALWVNELTGATHFSVDQILLPVGISFFTFQNISYLVDVYRRKVAHAENVLDFGFYTTFFPSLVAGPIIRADQFVPQLYKPYFLTKRQFGIALFWILNGLVKKIVMADYLAVNFVDRVFTNPMLFTPFENLSALFIYSLQVYADFSGYTDIATGVAMMMGFYLPKNFDSPYKATNAAGFWKRWHISLSNWLKDYLYIPLGGNRKGTWGSFLILGGAGLAVVLLAQNHYVTWAVVALAVLLAMVFVLFPKHRKEYVRDVNNMDTMLLGGMWHGASFNFITWGALNGVGILVYKYWKKCGPWVRVALTGALTGLLLCCVRLWPGPIWNLFVVWAAVLFAGTAVRYAIYAVRRGKEVGWLTRAWNVLVTFVFISFTRLFFRSGSNLDPAEANEAAWQSAKQMLTRIGGVWEADVVWPIVANYATVFALFALGMAVHWLPERWKRSYRLAFANLPLWALALATVATTFAIYQFITAELQPFIYFQF